MTIKEEEIKRVEIKKIYVAKDGTEFDTAEECKKYEETAKCAINGMFNKLKVQYTYGVGEYEPFHTFYCEDELYAVKIENADQLEITNKWIKSIDPSNEAIGADAIGTIQLINTYDGGGGAWIIGTPEKLKEIYCKGIDKLYNKLIEKTEETKGEEA